MPAPAAVVVLSDRTALAASAAGRLVTAITEAVMAQGQAHVVLTGGGVGTATLQALRSFGESVDWPRVHIWWGDERFLPSGHPDRNETQARAALLDHVDVDPGHVHPMPSADDAADPEASAAAYAATLAEHAGVTDRDGVPRFDVLLLGVGDDGHVASLFPEQPGTRVEDLTVIGVRGAPKPPPERVSLTFPAIAAAEAVWLLVAGAEKAGAVALALSGAGRVQVPAAGAAGRSQTLWLLDRSAAANLPPDVAGTIRR